MSQPKHYPPFGLHVPVTKLTATDGDTVSFWCGSKRKWRGRLLSCWCPFERGHERWKEGKDTAAEFIAGAKSPSVFIPFQDDMTDVLETISTLGRLLVYVYLDERNTLNKLMVDAGMASTTRNGELGK
jgi:endonuclease YncB( thermonuclease family)